MSASCGRVRGGSLRFAALLFVVAAALVATLGGAASGGQQPSPTPPPSEEALFMPEMSIAPAPAAPRARMLSKSAYPGAGGALGVTTGGMQDIGQTRKMIEKGQIPSPKMIMVEGLLSEHDIPLEGQPSEPGPLYASASLAWGRRYGHKTPEAVVQLGFGIDLTMDEFKREPLNLAVVLDVSGSMQGNKIEATKKALATLVEKLDRNDRLAIVLFNNSARLLRESAPVTDRATVKKLIQEINANGSTNIESGLKLGYQQVAAHLKEKEKSPRGFLLTDEQPNVGATTAGGFLPMMKDAAAKGIGLSAFGVGIDFGQDLAYEIFQIKGANYFFLEDGEKIAKVFDDEFEFMVTPVAYGVNILLMPAKGVKVTDVLGVPDYEEGAEGVEMKIPTLFLSKRQGGCATLVALELPKPPGGAEEALAEIALSFVPAEGEKRVTQRLGVFLPGGLGKTEAPYYSQPGAKKAQLLSDLAVALKAACRGQKAPSQDDIRWLPPVASETDEEPGGAGTHPRGGRGGRGGAPDAYYPYTVTRTKEQAAAAAEGLSEFNDWFAGQIAGIPGVDEVEKELRLSERLERTLRDLGGLPLAKPRAVPEEAQPDLPPPEVEIF